MRRQIRYRKAPKTIGEAIEEAEIIEDFLPDPDQMGRITWSHRRWSEIQSKVFKLYSKK